MRSFYMIRHGETTTNFEKLATGQLDIELTEKGKNQAEQCRDTIRSMELKLDVILCSGLVRTKQTDDIINEKLGCPIFLRPELNEQNYGDWENKPWESILSEIKENGENPPNGESQLEFYNRINSAIENLLEIFDGTILFVSHAGVFKSVYSKFNLSQSNIENGVLYEFKFSLKGDVLLEVLKHN